MKRAVLRLTASVESMKRLFFIVILLNLSVSAAAQNDLATEPPVPLEAPVEPVPDERRMVEEVLSGNLIMLVDGETLRLAGIVAPERSPHGDPATLARQTLVKETKIIAYSREAKKMLMALIAPAEEVQVEYYLDKKDGSGNRLAYVHKCPVEGYEPRAGEGAVAEGLLGNLLAAKDKYSFFGGESCLVVNAEMIERGYAFPAPAS